jgi:uncharacterized protein (DUF924 family)
MTFETSPATGAEAVGASTITSAEIVSFWREAGPKAWFSKDDELDTEIRRRFLGTHEAAAEGLLSDWETSAGGALALLILLDQFPRNMFRDTPRMFASDPLARALAAGAIVRGFDAQVPKEMRTFFYLPFMHSETMPDQARSVAFYKAIEDADSLKWADEHADIVRRFGRFPHRNAVLGRASTPEEQAFLDAGGFSG